MSKALTPIEIAAYPVTREESVAFADQFKDLAVKDINDKYGLAQVAKGRKACKALRIEIDKVRKAQVEDALQHQRLVNGLAKDLIGPVKDREDALKAEEDRIAALVEEAQQAALAGRQEQLRAVGAKYPDSLVMKMTSEEFGDLLHASTETFEAAEVLRKAEVERLAREEAERKERVAKEDAERKERIAREEAERKERVAKEEEQRREAAAKEEAERKERVAKEEAERKERVAKEEEQRLEAAAKEEAERAEREKAEAAERRAQQDELARRGAELAKRAAEIAEQEKEEAARLAEKRRLELAPDVEKARAFISEVSGVVVPDCVWKTDIESLMAAFLESVEQLITKP